MALFKLTSTKLNLQGLKTNNRRWISTNTLSVSVRNTTYPWTSRGFNRAVTICMVNPSPRYLPGVGLSWNKRLREAQCEVSTFYLKANRSRSTSKDWSGEIRLILLLQPASFYISMATLKTSSSFLFVFLFFFVGKYLLAETNHKPGSQTGNTFWNKAPFKRANLK